jgi:hypothetical protein
MSENRTPMPQFIVFAAPALLAQILSDLEPDPGITIVAVTGPLAAPERFVAQMPQALADNLQQALGDDVLIEPDQPLDQFS